MFQTAKQASSFGCGMSDVVQLGLTRVDAPPSALTAHYNVMSSDVLHGGYGLQKLGALHALQATSTFFHQRYCEKRPRSM